MIAVDTHGLIWGALAPERLSDVFRLTLNHSEKSVSICEICG